MFGDSFSYGGEATLNRKRPFSRKLGLILRPLSHPQGSEERVPELVIKILLVKNLKHPGRKYI